MKLVTTPSAPDPAGPVKAMPKPTGMLQCNRCGGRTSVTVTNGTVVRNGRKIGGTVLERDVCDDCRRLGIYSPMVRPLGVVS